MKVIISLAACLLLLLKISPVSGQQIKFNKVLSTYSDAITSMKQDQLGYIWYTTQKSGLQRYDGMESKSYVHDPKDPNSLAGNYGECLWIDSLNIIWIGTRAGLDRFDPSANTFTHFRYDPKDSSSLSSDTVTAVLEDHLGNLWVGTHSGLNLLDRKTGKFKHYPNKTNDAASLSYNSVRVIYEDKSGTLWVGCGSPDNEDGETSVSGGLNRLDRLTGKFTRYMHDPGNPNSIANNKVMAILENSKGNFWVGTGGDGLHTMDRENGTFTHYYYDSAHPEKLSRPVFNKVDKYDNITFITEDSIGAIWIGTFYAGINRYDPVTKNISHHGPIFLGNREFNDKDTITGLNDFSLLKAIVSKDGLLWICTYNGNIFNVNPLKTILPYYPINNGLMGITFHHEQNGNILWIGTDKGLIRKNLNDQTQKIWLPDSLNANSQYNNFILGMRVDGEGKFWMATWNGLCKFDPVSNAFTTFRHSEKNPASISSNNLYSLCIDSLKNIWIATYETGLDKLDHKTKVFTNYKYKSKVGKSPYGVYCIIPGPGNEIWAGTFFGIYTLNQDNGKFRQYLDKSIIRSIFFDSSGVAWAGTPEGLYYLDKATDQFLLFVDPVSHAPITEVLDVFEDDKNNLWVTTRDAIVKINEKRNGVKRYGKNYGVHKNLFDLPDNFKAKNGQLFFGDQTGYYSFFPDQLKDADVPPTISFTSFKIGDQVITAGEGSVLKAPIWKTDEIKLNYNQNVFSFDFVAISYTEPGDMKYMFMLENYDNTWRNIGTDHKAYFFNVPPGRYIFKVRGVNIAGVWSEKTIKIFISPPWWKTWWAYSIFALLFTGIIAGFISYRSRALRRENRVLEEKVAQRTEQLKQSLEDLKSTQSQLIQSEKMASLGALTAGIAHEIQNPLNFVNNFSDVNKELLEELKEELAEGSKQYATGNMQSGMEKLKSAEEIANDVIGNEQKINHHGKRADAIVKGMLQHSRSNTGHKEPTDINALADEYLRLSYHGMRAKDKTFNAEYKTDFDLNLPKINVVPQDIGRVLLNLINNAFYAVDNRAKLLTPPPPEGGSKNFQTDYRPTVTISTASFIPPSGGPRGVRVVVKDNGDGIPSSIVDKIFQPFFTTKPTGQGTGLGLSLAYDIVKAHGGELKVETKPARADSDGEGFGSEFIIQIPMN